MHRYRRWKEGRRGSIGRESGKRDDEKHHVQNPSVARKRRARRPPQREETRRLPMQANEVNDQTRNQNAMARTRKSDRHYQRGMTRRPFWRRGQEAGITADLPSSLPAKTYAPSQLLNLPWSLTTDATGHPRAGPGPDLLRELAPTMVVVACREPGPGLLPKHPMMVGAMRRQGIHPGREARIIDGPTRSSHGRTSVPPAVALGPPFPRTTDVTKHRGARRGLL